MAYRQWTFQPTGQIACVCPGTRRDNNGYIIMQICLINADGSGRRQLTDLTADASTPAWSPDGQRLVFKAAGQIVILNLNGTNTVEQVELKSEQPLSTSWPRWSPDGLQLIFLGRLGGQGTFDLYSSSVDGSSVKKRVSDVAFGPADWSPDGQLIAYTQAGSGAIHLIRHDGSLEQRLGDRCGFQSWSPDSSAIICNSDYDLWVVQANGTGSTKVKSCLLLRLNCANPSWSPDGNYWVYSQTDWRYFSHPGVRYGSRPPTEQYLDCWCVNSKLRSQLGGHDM
jgi:Tol biopolymer transport system component